MNVKLCNTRGVISNETIQEQEDIRTRYEKQDIRLRNQRARYTGSEIGEDDERMSGGKVPSL